MLVVFMMISALHRNWRVWPTLICWYLVTASIQGPEICKKNRSYCEIFQLFLCRQYDSTELVAPSNIISALRVSDSKTMCFQANTSFFLSQYLANTIIIITIVIINIIIMIAVYAAPCPPDPPYLLYKQPYPCSRQHLQVERIETNHSALYMIAIWSNQIRFWSNQI